MVEKNKSIPGCNLPSRALAAKRFTSDEICAKPYEHFKDF